MQISSPQIVNVIEKSKASFTSRMSDLTDLSRFVITYLQQTEKELQRRKSRRYSREEPKAIRSARRQTLPPQCSRKKIDKLVSRLIEMGEIKNNIFVYSIALVERCRLTKKFRTFSSIIELFAAALFIAQKIVLDGEYWYAPEFEVISEIASARLISHEQSILKILDFRTHVDEVELRKCYLLLSRDHGKKKRNAPVRKQ